MMTAYALVSGSLSRAPEVKTSKGGKPYTTATIKITADKVAEFWSVMAFGETAQAELSRLKVGDAVTAQGSFKVENYTARDGQTKINRTVFADLILALRQPPRERAAA
jgi:single-stranded DNA-binding protein